MKIRTFASIGILLLVSVATLAAQNSLPNPHDDACWSSLSALHACQIQAYDEAQAYAQNCTSYPEYQCFDYYQPPQKTSATATKVEPKAASTAANSGAVSSPNVQSSSAN